MLNAITIDVEEWFHVSRFRKQIKRDEWPNLESRVLPSVARVLTILQNFNIRATFFILGWIAERHPEVVRMIEERGHDIGTHGYGHQLVYDMSPKEFEQDLSLSLKLLRDVATVPIHSYRAPSFSINYNSLWAFEILKDHGIDVDSSLFPVKHDLYGGIQSPKEFFYVSLNGSGNLVECPLATRRVADRSFPIAGGGYLRMFPLWFLEKSIKVINDAGRPAVIYFHPWEIDQFQPRVPAKMMDRFLHYNNIDQTEEKLCALLAKFPFSKLQDVIDKTTIDKTWPEW
ncbi:DUF3473 domain-containing protein [candidate division KSB1 bacterium]|nr:DUF3473 domain-containing protein [candidate division KSB1 bacterium]RQW09434.1 MAG: DUF3473 domain-containing protein [candidate division KSB1 bacterium]